MAAIYEHGTSGEFAESIASTPTQSGTVNVYVGVAPVNLVRGYADADVINSPVLLTDKGAVQRYMGYSPDFASFSLCEAFAMQFYNPFGNSGPVVAINVLDPDTHKKPTETTLNLTFVNGRATIKSDTIILDTLALENKVEDVDYSIDYDFTAGQVILQSIGSTAITGTVSASFFEVDPSKITQDDIIGGVTAGGEYSGFGVVELIYQELHLIPNNIGAPGWSEIPDVYNAMITAGTKIDGHWDSYIYADIPILDGSTAIDTIEKAKKWKSDNGYISERTKPCWPQFDASFGGVFHGSTYWMWRQQLVDASHNGIPMETASNKGVPIKRQHFGANSKNRGFGEKRANELNAAGISTAIYAHGEWVLWGGHTGKYTFGAVTDKRAIFDNNIRMMMYITNKFQQKWALDIDAPMTVQKADTIKNQEQDDADALVAIGALIGSPVVRFDKTSNSTDDLAEGNFVWDFEGTPTPQSKSLKIRVAYTDAGFNSYFGEEA